MKSRQDEDQSAPKPILLYDPDSLIGRIVLLQNDNKCECLRATISKKIIEPLEEIDDIHHKTVDNINFLIKLGQGRSETILSYNQMLDHLEQENQQDQFYKLRAITAHKKPLSKKDSDYKGCLYNVMIEWERGETTKEPLSSIAADDPATCAVYANKNDLLHLEGWRQFRRTTKNQKKLTRAINMNKIRQVRRSTIFQFGSMVPRDYKQALELDEQNGKSKWYDATKLEMDQIKEYEVFKDVKSAKIDNKYGCTSRVLET